MKQEHRYYDQGDKSLNAMVTKGNTGFYTTFKK